MGLHVAIDLAQTASTGTKAGTNADTTEWVLVDRAVWDVADLDDTPGKDARRVVKVLDLSVTWGRAELDLDPAFVLTNAEGFVTRNVEDRPGGPGSFIVWRYAK